MVVVIPSCTRSVYPMGRTLMTKITWEYIGLIREWGDVMNEVPDDEECPIQEDLEQRLYGWTYWR